MGNVKDVRTVVGLEVTRAGFSRLIRSESVYDRAEHVAVSRLACGDLYLEIVAIGHERAAIVLDPAEAQLVVAALNDPPPADAATEFRVEVLRLPAARTVT